MKMYRDYLKERLGDELLEREEGFATYRFTAELGFPAVYIVDIYVRPDFRKTKVASEMADQIVAIARTRNFSRLIGSVSFESKNQTDSIKVLLGYGMEFYKAVPGGLFFKKEI